MSKPKPIAIAISDIHLSETAPLYRSGEENWFEAMRRPLAEVSELSEKLNVPVLCSGDVFDRWKSSPALINFAIDNLPRNFISIPGQHDLPNHRYDRIEEAAYGTLVKKNKLPMQWEPGDRYATDVEGTVNVVGFPFGKTLKKQPRLHHINIALVHEYTWIPGCNFPNAPEEGNVKKNAEKYDGWTFVLCGDNHIPFTFKTDGGATVINCGSLYRRAKDNTYSPSAWILFDDGSFERHLLDTTDDIYGYDEGLPEKQEASQELQTFIGELNGLETEGMDFAKAVRRYAEENPVADDVKTMLLEAIGD